MDCINVLLVCKYEKSTKNRMAKLDKTIKP